MMRFARRPTGSAQLSSRDALQPRTSTAGLRLSTPPRNQIFARFVAGCSSLLLSVVLTHAVLDVVVDDETEFFVSEAVVLCEGFVYLINNGL